MNEVERMARGQDARTVLERRLEADMRFHGHDVVTAEVQILVHGQMDALAAAGLTILPLKPKDEQVEDIAAAMYWSQPIHRLEPWDEYAGQDYWRDRARAAYLAATKGGA